MHGPMCVGYASSFVLTSYDMDAAAAAASHTRSKPTLTQPPCFKHTPMIPGTWRRTRPPPRPPRRSRSSTNKSGALTKALELYTQAVAADTTNPVYASNRSACLFELGRYEECTKDVEA